MNLTDYAVEKQTTRRTRCMTCNLPDDVRNQIESARNEQVPPVPFKTIATWLKEDQEIDLLQATIRNHFVAGHDND